MTDNKISIRTEGPLFETTIETKNDVLRLQLHIYSKETGTVSRYLSIKFPVGGDIIMDLQDEHKKELAKID